ncbi:unnamed protein product [Cylindrotheca closterium]|uniref:HD domain-containing protein n=1 Tax=Cylindrotheca closterium TaxID=2856 RepID=A0AAD2CN79_9STRA|nr:unnamed protein product [Cylindrotheca closterium]
MSTSYNRRETNSRSKSLFSKVTQQPKEATATNHGISGEKGENKNAREEKRFKLKKLTSTPKDFTRKNDEVHYSVDICPVMKAIIDTEQFQRLRNIKQLGASDLVFASADHNRFQHSIGVAYLAQQMCARIRNRQPHLGTTLKDVLCVTLAGLLHDIGHGPFSHVYEHFRSERTSEMKKDRIRKEKHENNFPTVPQDWTHEDSSLLMIDATLKSLGLAIDVSSGKLDEPLKQIGDGIDRLSMRVFKGDGTDNFDDDDVLTSRDFIFIKECIFGKPLRDVVEKLGKEELIGRTDPKKAWLYDIVANRHNGIDVDKVDYFARDGRRSLALAGKINCQIIYEAMVAKADTDEGEQLMICYPKKCVEEVLEFFRFRFKMHGTVYQHKTTSAAGAMIVDILRLADPYYVLPAGSKRHSISSAVLDPDAFLALNDNIIENIKYSTSADLKPARDLAARFLKRDLYKFAGEMNIKSTDSAMIKKAKNQPEEIVREICSIVGNHEDEDGNPVTLEESDVIVQFGSWHYGRKDANPLTAVRFVNRQALCSSDEILTAHEVNEDDYETLLPRKFMKQCIRVYCRNPSKTDLLLHMFQAWRHNLENGAEIHEQQSSSPFANSQDHLTAEISNLERPGYASAVALTQDSGEEDNHAYTPIKRKIQATMEEESPIPLHRRRLN